MSRRPLERRAFLARVLGAVAGGAWLGREAPGTAVAATQYDMPYLGEIRMFAGDFEPWGWRFCDGRLLDIVDYDPLYQVLGTTYGGDGQLTFGLPDLRGRAPIHAWTTQRGGIAGEEAVTLTGNQIPAHNHTLQGSSAPGPSDDPTGRVPARSAVGAPHYGANMNATLSSSALNGSGAFQPHNNMMPSLCVNFIICIENGT